MIRHHDEFIEQIHSLIAADKNSLNKNFSNPRHSEKFAPLPRGGGNEIRPPRAHPVGQLTHRNFRG